LEEAKAAYVTHHKKNFDIDWTDRSTVVSEQWTIEEQVYEEVEEIEEIEEVIEEEEAKEIIKRQEEVIEKETVTEVTTEVITEAPAPKGQSWFRRAVGAAAGAAGAAAGAVAHGAGAAAGAVVHGAESAAHGAGNVAKGVAAGGILLAGGAGAAASGALHKVDGVWKRAVQVVTTRKAHVDEKSPIAKTSFVYYDDDVYDSVLVNKDTGVTHVNQLLFDTKTDAYYVYIRWSETDYKLDGPYKTVEEAKDKFQAIYNDWYGIQWKDRESAVSGKLTGGGGNLKVFYCSNVVVFLDSFLTRGMNFFVVGSL
jgi:hypothetical protein